MDLHRVLGLLRRGWLILVLALLLGTGLGVARNELTPPAYSSRTALLYSLNSRGSLSVLAEGSTYVQAMMPSYVTVIESPLVLDPVILQLNLDTTPSNLAHQIEVQHDTDSVIIEITVVDADPLRAARIANALANQVSIVTSALAPHDAGSLGQITVAQISQAFAATDPFTPVLAKNLAIGVAIGLILGVGSIILWDAVFSSAINSRDAVARATRAPVIGTIALDPKSRSRRLPVDSQPLLARSESFRFLESNLSKVLPGKKICVVIASAREEEGRTTTAANLAIAMSLSRPDRKVLLIDADLRSAAMADLLGVPPEVGLTTLVSSPMQLEDAVVQWRSQQPEGGTLGVLAAGPRVPEPSDLLASKALQQLIIRAREMFDVVIIDSGPLLTVADAAILAAQADGAIMVVDVKRTRHRQFAESLVRMRLAGARVMGVVLNRIPDSTNEYQSSRPPRHDVEAQAAGRHEHSRRSRPHPSTPAPTILANSAGGSVADGFYPVAGRSQHVSPADEVSARSIGAFAAAGTGLTSASAPASAPASARGAFGLEDLAAPEGAPARPGPAEPLADTSGARPADAPGDAPAGDGRPSRRPVAAGPARGRAMSPYAMRPMKPPTAPTPSEAGPVPAGPAGPAGGRSTTGGAPTSPIEFQPDRPEGPGGQGRPHDHLDADPNVTDDDDGDPAEDDDAIRSRGSLPASASPATAPLPLSLRRNGS